MQESYRSERLHIVGIRWACFLAGLLLYPSQLFSAPFAGTPEAGPIGRSRSPEIIEIIRTQITGEAAGRQDHLSRIRELIERTREAWKGVQQATQEVWEKAQQKTREIWRRSRQDPEELRRKALQEIQQAWSKAQKEVQDLFRRAQQEVEELWKKAQQEAQRYENRSPTQDSEQGVEIRTALDEALVFIVPGTDARVPLTDLGANPDWLKDNIETILKGHKGRHSVKNFEYKQPWLPGICTNRKGICYQTNVAKLADAMLKQFAKCCKDGKAAFKIVAHSYGAAITYDALKKLDQDPEAATIGLRVDRLVTLSPAPLTLYRVVPANVAVWKNIHGGFGYVDGIGDKNNIQVNIPPEPGKIQAILKEKRFKLNADHSAIVNDKRGKEAIRKALAP